MLWVTYASNHRDIRLCVSPLVPHCMEQFTSFAADFCQEFLLSQEEASYYFLTYKTTNSHNNSNSDCLANAAHLLDAWK